MSKTRLSSYQPNGFNPIQSPPPNNSAAQYYRRIQRSPPARPASKAPTDVVVVLPLFLLHMASPPPAPAASGPNSVFVYGTLMEEEVVRILLNRVPPSAPALLPNHQRYSIKGRVYPAILPVQGKQVNGKVFRDLTDRELEVFDIFEDEEYVRKTVEVSLTDTSEKLLVYAYIWGNPSDPDLYGEWDFEEWRKVHLKDYLEMTQEFIDELEKSESKP